MNPRRHRIHPGKETLNVNQINRTKGDRQNETLTFHRISRFTHPEDMPKEGLKIIDYGPSKKLAKSFGSIQISGWSETSHWLKEGVRNHRQKRQIKIIGGLLR